jgi:hypothetical protein
LDDINNKQPKTPDERDTFRLEFIELNCMQGESHPSPQKYESANEPPASHSTPLPRHDGDLPDFPVNPEMWEQFEKSVNSSSAVERSEYRSSLNSSEIERCLEKPVSQPIDRMRVGPVDYQLEDVDLKPWNIIIERGSGRTYGFSKAEYSEWLRSQKLSRKITVKCNNCEQDIEDNPFTGFHFCPFCGTKISILGDDIRRIREVQESAIRESQQQALSNPKFLTYPLDIPGILISSLTPPKFELVLANYHGMIAPLIALLMLLALIVVIFIESQLLSTRIYLIIATFIAINLNIIALRRDMGVHRIVLNQNGITFIRLNSSTTFRFERIIDIRVKEEISMFGSLKQRNVLLVLLFTPVVLFAYVLTAGLINLYESLHDPGDPVKNEKDRIVSVWIKTRGSTLNFKINKSLQPDFSRLMGILIYMTKLESRGVIINEKAIFAAQRSFNASINAKKMRIDAIGSP